MAQIEYSRPWKLRRKDVPDGLFGLPKSSFGMDKSSLKTHSERLVGSSWNHPSQIFVWEGRFTVSLCSPNEDFGRSNRRVRMRLRSAFQWSELSTQFGPWSIENLCSPNEDFGRMNKRWNADFRITFQGREYLNLGHEQLKSASKILISSFVPRSKIFVWEP